MSESLSPTWPRNPAARSFSLIPCVNGEPVCDAVPCDEWDVAQVFAPLVHAITGRQVSVGRAVAEFTRTEPDDQLGLFEEGV